MEQLRIFSYIAVPEIVLVISPVLFASQKTMSTSFSPQYISFKMNGVKIILNHYTDHYNRNTKWVRFCGTPCSLKHERQNKLPDTFDLILETLDLPTGTCNLNMKPETCKQNLLSILNVQLCNSTTRVVFSSIFKCFAM